MDINAFPTSYLLMSIGIMILLSAYFSGTETAMMALNRYRLRHLVRRGNRGAKKADSMLRRQDRLLGVILVGNNLVNFSAATVATVIGFQLMGDAGVLLAPWVLTIVFLIFAEVAPKTLAAERRELGTESRLYSQTSAKRIDARGGLSQRCEQCLGSALLTCQG